MSIPVELSSLTEAIARFGYAYLMTTTAQGAPHVVAVFPVLQDGEIVVPESGRRTRENAAQRPAVGLVWPPSSPAEHSLIVDGTATVSGSALRIAPTRAVLHRAAPPRPAPPGTCGSDCIELRLE